MDIRKRGIPESSNGGASKKFKPDSNSLSSGIGRQSKPCTKFFSTTGCTFGDNCHFLHYVPGGYDAVAQMMNSAPTKTAWSPTHGQNVSALGATKTKICNNFKTEGGCKFGDRCSFAHGERELIAPPNKEASALIFGASTTIKISVDASAAGAVIRKGGVRSKQICQETGVKLSIRDHKSNPNLRIFKLRGAFEQIQQASVMVREMVVSIGEGAVGPASNFKTKLCVNFMYTSCSFGEGCHFAHGEAELRKTKHNITHP